MLEISRIRALAYVAAAGAMLGCESPSPCPPADLAPLEREPAFVFLASDYVSSAVGLLDEDGRVIREAWFDSGTVAPTLVPALSGDVVLASQPVAPCVLAVIDRSGTDVVTFLDACSPDVLVAQVDVGPSFNANPQDVLAIDADRALVSRFEPNLRPDADEREHGNDLLVVEWRRGQIAGRLDLSSLNVGGPQVYYARPVRMVLLRSGAARVVAIGLARLSGDFMAAGPGAVALVEPATMQLSELALDGLVNCGEIDAAPGAQSVAIVTCQGATFETSPEGRRASAGVAAIELGDDGAVTVRAVWRAADHPDSPVFNTWAAPLDGQRVAVTAMGGIGIRPDLTAIIDLGHPDESPEVIAEGVVAFSIGDGIFDTSSASLLLPDANAGTIRRFWIGDDVMELSSIAASGCRGLPPLEVRSLRPQ